MKLKNWIKNKPFFYPKTKMPQKYVLKGFGKYVSPEVEAWKYHQGNTESNLR